MKPKGYRNRLKVNRYRIVDECEEQAQLYMDWALKAAKAEIETKEAENDWELTKGQIEKKIRRDPQRYGIEKITESAVKVEINGNIKVKKYYRRYLEALSNEKVLKRAEKAYQQRKGMCESIAHLNVQLHFAEPTVRMSTDESKEADKSTRSEILSNLKKNKRRLKRRKQ